jgi:hypothetical protein
MHDILYIRRTLLHVLLLRNAMNFRLGFHSRKSPLLLIVLCSIFIGCSPREEASAPAIAVPPEQMNAVVIVEGEKPSDEQQRRMLAAKESLFQKLSGRLMETMSTEGPAAAIDVCQKEAPQIAQAVGEEQGVSIDRTGLRLRNPLNQTPAWATSLVESKVDTPTL